LYSSREQIFELLKGQVKETQHKKLKDLLDYLSPNEIRHIDFLIYLVGYYKSAKLHLINAIFEILMEDERALEALLGNFGLKKTESGIVKSQV
jgi:hypothetical protein